MNSWDRLHYALTSCVSLAMLAGCGGAPQRIGPPETGVQPASRADRVPHAPTSSSYEVLYRFDRYPDGAHPQAPLILVKGTLYGTAYQGGKNCGSHHLGKYGCGTVYSVTPSGVEHTLFVFDPSQQGAFPASGLIDVKGLLYGTTYKGGTGVGTVYTVTTGGTENVIHNFGGPSDGFFPAASLVDVHGTLYGTTEEGGKKDGTVYSITASGVETVLHVFKGRADGDIPSGGLIDVNGTLYGTTLYGGTKSSNCPDGCGTVYSITPNGVENVVYRFTGVPDGARPIGNLVDVNGALYGTTSFGGNKYGTVYTVTTSGQENVLYDFAGGSDGAYPQAGLVDVNGTLYGTTENGGNVGCNLGCGTVYSISTTGAESVLYSFAGGSNGAYPVAPLVDVNGTLYGTTVSGGKPKGNCCGTVFALVP
jgi:uncharacterized repeat protein (TIGR03803 family)